MSAMRSRLPARSRAARGARRTRAALRASAAEGEAAPAAATAPPLPETLVAKLPVQVARTQVRLGQVGTQGAQSRPSDLRIYVDAVADGGDAEAAGLKPGQVLKSLTHPTRDEMWELSGDERLRFVRDAVETTHKDELELVVERDITITAAMVSAFNPPAPSEEEQEAAAAEARRQAEIAARRAAAAEPTERPDLYSDSWDGDQYTGSGWNELTALIAISLAVPVVGLVFALVTRGSLWDIPTM